MLIVKHLNRVDVLSSVFDGLRASEINVETENIIFEGATTNVARIAVEASHPRGCSMSSGHQRAHPQPHRRPDP